ncbi:MAG TPA: thrombospondin type 3 repeat-containing protein [Polyangiaceae bacterium]
MKVRSPSSHAVPSPSRRLVRRLRVCSGVLGVFCALAVVSGEARAQSIQDEFTVQRFNPAPGPRNFFTTRGARTDGQMAWSAGLFVNYASQPFVVESCESLTNCDEPNALFREDVPVVENLATADLMGTLTPIPRLQIGLRVPITWVSGDGITEEGTPHPDGISAVGLGDAELEGKFRLHGEPRDTFVVGGAAFVTGPLGHATSEGNYIGDSTPTVGVRGIMDGESGPFSFGGNLAAVYRGTGKVGSTELGSEFRYNVAGGFKVSPVLRVVAEGFGGTKFSTKQGTNSLEALLGVQILPLASSIAISAGAGTGIVQGVGVPNIRAFAGFVYSAEHADRDNDGVPDDADQCPTEPEDRDGSEDSDGCPDGDNDGDGIADAADKCPKEAEDGDGFQDTDGCPDPDNDGDGIPDTSDRCADKPETKNGFNDEDGCPDEPDSDNDGVPDAKDKCPKEPEDTDGFEDADGCPDLDNDKDGIPDSSDECVDEPETKNKFEDDDGCPDDPKKKK